MTQNGFQQVFLQISENQIFGVNLFSRAQLQSETLEKNRERNETIDSITCAATHQNQMTSISCMKIERWGRLTSLYSNSKKWHNDIIGAQHPPVKNTRSRLS